MILMSEYEITGQVAHLLLECLNAGQVDCEVVFGGESLGTAIGPALVRRRLVVETLRLVLAKLIANNVSK